MFDYTVLQNNTENPTALTITITVLMAFFLSSLIVFTYEVTNKDINRSIHFLQSMTLISIVAATVMQAIGDSLARGLGMLGALAIIRFRTRLNDPRNITFMFAALAAGIACGVYGFVIATIGTIGFCLVAIFIRFSPLFTRVELVGTLRLRIPGTVDKRKELESLLNRNCKLFLMTELRLVKAKRPKAVVKDNETDTTDGTETVPINKEELPPREQLQELTYQIKLKNKVAAWDLTSALEQMEGARRVRLSFNEPVIDL